MHAYFNVRSSRHVGALMFISLIVAGCSMFSGETKLHKNLKGSVYLKEIADWSFEASHPATIDPMTMLKIVKGVVTDDVQNMSGNMPASGSKPMRVFSDEDAEFLAPLLAQALSKAKPEQLVGFRVSPSAGSGSEPTAGSIYVQEGSIYLTVSKGVGATTFLPEAVAHSEHAQPYAAGGMAGVTMHVIDYHALASTPMPAAMPVARSAPKAQAAPIPVASTSSRDQTSSPVQIATPSNGEIAPETAAQLTYAKETILKKDSEIIMLRKEAEWMKRQLHSRDEEIKALRASKVSAKPALKKKHAEATPTR